MKRIVTTVVLTFAAYASQACTSLIVGRNASTDGSVFCTYNADDYGMFAELCHYPAARHPKGAMREIYDWENHEFHGRIPEASQTYNVIGNINEYQVTITETTYGGRPEMVDSTGILDYGSLIYIALQRSRTAREAIHVMTNLAETYGYRSEGETFSICDPHEAWIMEMMGKGPGSHGVVWVALRIPDNAICAHANQSRIGRFNIRDKSNVLYSPDVVSFARSKGWYAGRDKDFSWKDSYARPDFSGRRFCEARVWSFFRRFDSTFDRYLPWILGYDEDAEDMPLWIIPDRHLSLSDVQACMRDHYEGTPLAIDTMDIGGGIWQMPYRPTPLTYTVDGKKYFNERPISTQQTAFTIVGQMRAWMPRQIGGVLWFGNDDANTIAYTPVYCSAKTPPPCYSTPGADAVTYSDQNAYWICNMVSNMVYPRYSQMFPDLAAVRDSLETSYLTQQPEIERQALQLCAQDTAAAVDYLTRYGISQAQLMLHRWRQLAIHLIVKYNDMAVKPEREGAFLRTQQGHPARVKRPGYPQSYAKQLVKTTGDKYKVP